MTKPPLTAIAVLLSALLLAPSVAAAKTKIRSTTYAYKVTKAEGSETATFQGDGTPVCASAGLCGVSGTVSYTFTHVNNGFATVTVLTRGHRHAGFGDFEFGIDGTTTSNVSQAGVAQPCTDTVKHRSDILDVLVSGSHVLFGLHAINADAFSGDYLDTHCAGPTEEDMVAARVLPAVEFPLKSLKRRSLTWQFGTNTPFHSGPFTGTLQVNATYTLVRDRKAERQLNKKG
jgi:hypothetical protein